MTAISGLSRGPCRSCNAPCVWVPSVKTGKLMILDAEPVSDGRIVIEDGKARVLTKDLYEQPPGENEPRYKDHHVTCPSAAAWKRSK